MLKDLNSFAEMEGSPQFFRKEKAQKGHTGNNCRACNFGRARCLNCSIVPDCIRKGGAKCGSELHKKTKNIR